MFCSFFLLWCSLWNLKFLDQGLNLGPWHWKCGVLNHWTTREFLKNSYFLKYQCEFRDLDIFDPMDGGAWCAAVHGVARSQTRLSDFTSTFHFHALEKEMATHSSVLAWRIPGTGEPGGLPSMGLHRNGHNWSDLAAAAARYYQSLRLQKRFHFLLVDFSFHYS